MDWGRRLTRFAVLAVVVFALSVGVVAGPELARGWNTLADAVALRLAPPTPTPTPTPTPVPAARAWPAAALGNSASVVLFPLCGLGLLLALLLVVFLAVLRGTPGVPAVTEPPLEPEPEVEPEIATAPADDRPAGPPLETIITFAGR